MRPTTTTSTSVEELRTISRFEGLRKILMSQKYADHLDKPLAYWALPTDRRLPLAFLGRTLEDLLNTPFAELSETPGIGQKKIYSFVQLLARAADTDPSELPVELSASHEADQKSGPNGSAAGKRRFDHTSVSEVTWSQWRATVVRHGLGDETLGRLAPSLGSVTRVIWNVTLKAYGNRTLSEIRSMKTHAPTHPVKSLKGFLPKN